MHVSWYLFGCARYRSPKSVSDKGPPFDTPMRDVTHTYITTDNTHIYHVRSLVPRPDGSQPPLSPHRPRALATPAWLHFLLPWDLHTARRMPMPTPLRCCLRLVLLRVAYRYLHTYAHTPLTLKAMSRPHFCVHSRLNARLAYVVHWVLCL